MSEEQMDVTGRLNRLEREHRRLKRITTVALGGIGLVVLASAAMLVFSNRPTETPEERLARVVISAQRAWEQCEQRTEVEFFTNLLLEKVKDITEGRGSGKSPNVDVPSLKEFMATPEFQALSSDGKRLARWNWFKKHVANNAKYLSVPEKALGEIDREVLGDATAEWLAKRCEKEKEQQAVAELARALFVARYSGRE